MSNELYRARTFLRHNLTAWHTGGEGVHSPNLFRLVSYDIYDHNSYYAFRAIEKQRRKWRNSNQVIIQDDFGSCTKGNTKGIQRSVRVSRIAKQHLEQPKIGQLLFRLVMALGRKKNQPLNIVELGASLGITTAYLASPSAQNRVTTYEGAPQVAGLAKETWKNLNLTNILLVEGDINATLFNNCGQDGQNIVDLAFIDANHTEQATVHYFETLAERTNEDSIIVIDDIYHSPGMTRAWKSIKRNARTCATIDLWYVGLVLFNKHYQPRHYRMRI